MPELTVHRAAIFPEFGHTREPGVHVPALGCGPQETGVGVMIGKLGIALAGFIAVAGIHQVEGARGHAPAPADVARLVATGFGADIGDVTSTTCSPQPSRAFGSGVYACRAMVKDGPTTSRTLAFAVAEFDGTWVFAAR